MVLTGYAPTVAGVIVLGKHDQNLRTWHGHKI
jgi:hypothetical protein